MSCQNTSLLLYINLNYLNILILRYFIYYSKINISLKAIETKQCYEFSSFTSLNEGACWNICVVIIKTKKDNKYFWVINPYRFSCLKLN